MCRKFITRSNNLLFKKRVWVTNPSDYTEANREPGAGSRNYYKKGVRSRSRRTTVYRQAT